MTQQNAQEVAATAMREQLEYEIRESLHGCPDQLVVAAGLESMEVVHSLREDGILLDTNLGRFLVKVKVEVESAN